jgi:hypothetical protein
VGKPAKVRLKPTPRRMLPSEDENRPASSTQRSTLQDVCDVTDFLVDDRPRFASTSTAAHTTHNVAFCEPQAKVFGKW